MEPVKFVEIVGGCETHPALEDGKAGIVNETPGDALEDNVGNRRSRVTPGERFFWLFLANSHFLFSWLRMVRTIRERLVVLPFFVRDTMGRYLALLEGRRAASSNQKSLARHLQPHECRRCHGCPDRRLWTEDWSLVFFGKRLRTIVSRIEANTFGS